MEIWHGKTGWPSGTDHQRSRACLVRSHSPVFADLHGGRLTIDLRALAGNWRQLAGRAGPAETAAAVKADAYGLGIEAVVPALLQAGCRSFFVAHFSEALRVRAVAPDAVIYVLNGLPPQGCSAFHTLDLRPVLGSLDEIAEWLAHSPQDAPAALHVDTGLNRLGLSPPEMALLPKNFRPALVMSHFVASEIPGDPINLRQIATFRAVRDMIPDVPASLCNSSGLFLPAGKEITFDMVRPGYALYGGNPTPGAPNPMREVVRLEARLIQLREVESGVSVGYNAQWYARRPSIIATVSLGYADGYLRSGGATAEQVGGKALVNGVECPLAGRISMDLITIDVTDVPGVRRGDWAVLVGGGLALDDVADRLHTNGYEVLTSLGRRHERVYLSS